ncbi:MAG: hypothetical protein NVV72_10965 [Asticcacaulis sp.]|nr:hypothetical protein [Asticcacaulis sp.]
MVIYNCAINAGSIFTQAMPKAWVLANYRPMGKSIGCVFKVDRVVQDFYWFEERQNTKSFVTDEPSVPKSDLSWYFEATAKSAGKAESSEIVAVINGFHQLVAKGEFSTIDSLITLCDVKKVRDEILVAFVESLYAFRKNIARYEKLFLKVGRELSARGYDRNEVLQGLSE